MILHPSLLCTIAEIIAHTNRVNKYGESTPHCLREIYQSNIAANKPNGFDVCVKDGDRAVAQVYVYDRSRTLAVMCPMLVSSKATLTVRNIIRPHRCAKHTVRLIVSDVAWSVSACLSDTAVSV